MTEHHLHLQFTGELPLESIDALAALLLSTGPDCELCGELPQEHFIDFGQWQGRHCCARCWESFA